jgi:hypothetical protein
MDPSFWPALVILPVGLLIAIIPLALPQVSPKSRVKVGENNLYQDRYLEIHPDHLILNGFYFGPYGKKRIAFDSIQMIKIIDLNFWTGSYRIQGTGDFRTWFAFDTNRPSKEKAFIIHRTDKWWRIGFSAQDVPRVADIFQAKGLLYKT